MQIQEKKSFRKTLFWQNCI